MLPRQVGAASAGPVGEQLMAVLGQGATVLIADMTATRSCDHAGTGVLARVYQRAVAQGTELRLVIGAAVVRRVVALSGLDQLVPVFATLRAARAAQPPAAVVPLPRRAAGHGSAALAPPGGPRPVAWLPVTGPARLDGSRPAAPRGMPRREFEDTLSRITGGIFEAGVTLQASLDQPADGLRQAAEHALDLLDETVREARDAAFAGHHAGHGLADTAERAAAPRTEWLASPVWPRATAGELMHQSRLRIMRARLMKAQSQQARARAIELVAMSAARQARVAEALNRCAATHQPARPSAVA